MPAGWTVQQITHCSASLACSDTLVNHSSAAATGEADLTSTATIVKQAAKTTAATVTTTATVATQKIGIYPQALAATVTTTATLAATKISPVVPGTDMQEIGELVAAVGGGVGA